MVTIQLQGIRRQTRRDPARDPSETIIVRSCPSVVPLVSPASTAHAQWWRLDRVDARGPKSRSGLRHSRSRSMSPGWKTPWESGNRLHRPQPPKKRRTPGDARRLARRGAMPWPDYLRVRQELRPEGRVSNQGRSPPRKRTPNVVPQKSEESSGTKPYTGKALLADVPVGKQETLPSTWWIPNQDRREDFVDCLFADLGPMKRRIITPAFEPTPDITDDEPHAHRCQRGHG